MKIPERLHCFVLDPETEQIYAAGRKGGVYKLDENFALATVSERTDHSAPICAITMNKDSIFTRDAYGTLIAWDKFSLCPKIIVTTDDSAQSIEELNEETVYSINHGLTCDGSSIYLNNGRGRIATYSCDNLELKSVCDPNQESFTETINVEVSANHVLSDFLGYLWKGDLATGEFTRSLRIDKGPIHIVRYDKRHNRYWATTDNGGGFAIVNADLTSHRLIPMTDDDIEWIAFDREATRAVVACFDHHIYLYDNTCDEPRLIRVHGPYKYQFRQVALSENGTIVALLQSGELFRIESSGRVSTKTEGFGNACWGLDPSPVVEGLAFGAFEDGAVRTIRFGANSAGGATLVVEQEHFHAFGRLRRAVPLKDGGYVAVGTRGIVFRVSSSGTLLWKTKFSQRTNDIALSHDEARIATGENDGRVTLMETLTGQKISEAKVPSAVWAVVFGADGSLFVGDRAFHITKFQNDLSTSKVLLLSERIKRLSWIAPNLLIATGPSGVTKIDADALTVKQNWQEELTQTCENALFLEDGIHSVFYDLKYIVYEKDRDKPKHLLHCLHDFPAGLTSVVKNGTRYVLVGGRGAYLSLFLTGIGHPRHMKTIHINSGRGDVI